MRRFASSVLWLALAFVLVLSRADASHRLSLLISQFPAMTGGDCGTTAGNGSILCGTVFARTANNLSDLGSASTARANLGLGTAATQNTGTSGANVPLLSTANTWGNGQTMPTLSGASTGSALTLTSDPGVSTTGSYIQIFGSTSGNPGLMVFGYNNASRGYFTPSGAFVVGPNQPTNSAVGEFDINKITASGTAPGAGHLKLDVVAGTTAGTCKIIAYAGTSTASVTVVDNVGSGC